MQKTTKRHKETILNKNIATTFVELKKKVYFIPVLTYTKNLGPKFAGSNPAEAVEFFGRKNPQHAFLRSGSKRICPMSQLCDM